MRRLPLYLTRQRNRLFTLSLLEPVIAQVGNTGEQDVYVQHGEPVGIRNLCDWFVRAVGRVPAEEVEALPFGVPRRIWLAGGFLD